MINIILKRLLTLLDANSLIYWSATVLDGSNIRALKCAAGAHRAEPGKAHESQFALRLLEGMGVQRQNGSMKRRGHAVLADKAYSGHVLRNELKTKGIKTITLEKHMRKWRRMVVHSLIVMPTSIAPLLNVALAG